MPLTIDLSHKLLVELADVRRENNEIKYLRPDSKSQVTLEYVDGKPSRIDSIVISTQHDEFDEDEIMLKKIKDDIINIVIPRFLKKNNLSFEKIYKDSSMKLSEQLNVKILPTTLFLNKNLDEIAKIEGLIDWFEKENLDFLKKISALIKSLTK